MTRTRFVSVDGCCASSPTDYSMLRRRPRYVGGRKRETGDRRGHGHIPQHGGCVRGLQDEDEENPDTQRLGKVHYTLRYYRLMDALCTISIECLSK